MKTIVLAAVAALGLAGAAAAGGGCAGMAKPTTAQTPIPAPSPTT
jgi:hypothetical protein